jgi:hypothetical protein
MANKAVPASEIIASKYGESEEDFSDDEENEPVEDVVDDLVYDAYNLVACNYHPLRFVDEDEREKVILEETDRAVSLLLKKLVLTYLVVSSVYLFKMVKM